MTLRDELDARGFAVLRADAALAALAPFEAVERVLGEPVLFVERQNIRAVPGGRSIASTSAEAPLHTDSQMILGVPATLQLLFCARPARQGGESVLVDSFPVLERAGPPVFEETLVQPFYFGEVRGPVAALRGGHFTVTLAPATHGPFREAIERAPVEVLRLSAGDVLVASNHRMVHGRRAFADLDRELVRLLVWLERPLHAPPALRARARECAPMGLTDVRVRAVTSLLRGVPPARIARDTGLDEARIYALRDACLSALLR